MQVLKAAASGEVSGSMKTENVEKLELQQVYSSAILDNSPASVGSPLFLPNLLQNIGLSSQELDEMALKYNVVSFLPSATNIEIGRGKT